jgi:hypothetical protein
MNTYLASIKDKLIQSGHYVLVSELEQKDPVTLSGEYRGVFQNKNYWYKASISSKMIAVHDEYAKSIDLICCEQNYYSKINEFLGMTDDDFLAISVNTRKDDYLKINELIEKDLIKTLEDWIEEKLELNH